MLNELTTVQSPAPTPTPGPGPIHKPGEQPPPPPPTTFSYDGNGNTIGRVYSNGSGNGFEWDAANRLIAITYSGNTNRTEFTYDGLSRRVKIVEKTDGTVTSTKQFVWNGMRIAEERDGDNTVTRRYYSQGEERVGGSDAGVYYYTRDHLGSIRELSDPAGSLRARYDYDAFGNTTKVSGDLSVDFGYTGHYYHAASNLYLAPYRAYDPTIGRWLSRDPIAETGGTNLFAYTANSPVDADDPLGLKTCWKNVIITSFGNLPKDKLGSRQNPLHVNDIAVGHFGTTQYPKPNDRWVLPFGTPVVVYPRNEQPYPGKVADVGAYDKKNPNLAGPTDWIDRWDPDLSKRNVTTDGWISVNVDDCSECPPGYKQFIDGTPPLLPPGLA